MNSDLVVLASDGNLCGEAPLWSPAQQTVTWVDMSSSLVFQMSYPERRKYILSEGLMVAGLARNVNESFVFAGATGLHLWSQEGSFRTVLKEHQGEPLFFNDIIADGCGRLYAGTCYWGPSGMEKTGCLYLIDSDLNVSVVDDGIELSNGLAFSGDRRTLYYADSTARCIYAYDVDPSSGELSRKRVFHRAKAEDGLPDGLTVDAEDHLWSAQWYGGQIMRYDPEGKVERRISLPAQQVSSLAFGGRELNELFVTTAAEPWDSPYAPAGFDARSPGMGGALYGLRLEIQGREENVARISVPQTLSL